MTKAQADRPFRFAVSSHGLVDADGWRELALKAEDLGYDAMYMSDHVSNELSPFSALTIAAEVTSHLRVGTLVLCNDFRHPVFTAKEIASVDVLSGGRVEWGMGAGWLPFDYDTAGLPFDDAPTRVDRLVESISLMKALFAAEPVTFTGAHYEVTGCDGQPKPIQRPHPPLIIGASQRRLLSFAGRTADVVSISPSLTARRFGDRPPSETVEQAIDRQVAEVKRAAGLRYMSIELSVVAFPTIITNNRVESAHNLTKVMGQRVEEVLVSPHVLVGTAQELCEQLEHRRARWDLSHWVIPAPAVETFAPVVARLSPRDSTQASRADGCAPGHA